MLEQSAPSPIQQQQQPQQQSQASSQQLPESQQQQQLQQAPVPMHHGLNNRSPAYPQQTPSPPNLSHQGGNNNNHTGKSDQPNILFVGNLSFFCEECHLFDLFDEYTHVNGVRIVRNDNRTRSLMFGFVTLSTVHEAKEMERVLNGSFFMGRRLKVAISDRRNEQGGGHGGRMSMMNEHENTGVQVHVAFSSFFPEDKIIRPTEGWLRKTFTKYGVLLDCCVKEYQQYKESSMQEGYGFIAFHSYEDAVKVTNICQNLNVQGITLTCSMSHLLHPGSKKGGMQQPHGGHMQGAGNVPQHNNRGGPHQGNRPFNNNNNHGHAGPMLQSNSMPPPPSSVSSNNNNAGNNNPPMMEGGHSPYHPHHPSMVYAPQGVPMPIQFVPAPNAMMGDHAPPMDGFSGPPPGYYPAPHSSASVASGSTNGSGSMAGSMNPQQMNMPNGGGPPPMGMYPMPMYSLSIPYNQPMLNNNDKNRKMSPTYSTSSYGSGPSGPY